jgi:hypothetical protein
VKPEIPPSLIQAIEHDMNRWLGLLREHEQFLPAVGWVASPLWQEAHWSGVAYQFDRHADSPPVMGLRFERPDKGQELFRSWTEKHGNCDELEEIRIIVIEGEIDSEQAGYFVHLSPDPENSMLRATAEGIVIDGLPLGMLAQMRRMNPIAGTTAMLPRFKELFREHGEFLFAPVSPREEGRQWVDLECGIVKKAIHFHNLADVDRNVLEAAKRLVELASPHAGDGYA